MPDLPERKEIVQSIYEEAKTMVDPEKKVQVLAKEGWNPGVLGIVAGRLLEELGQTVIVLNIEDGRAKGSARSVEAVDIFEALDPHRDLFIAFGGHAGAAGMTLEVEKLSDLSQVLEDYVIPFCTQICYYCDFSKVFIKNQPVQYRVQYRG